MIRLIEARNYHCLKDIRQPLDRFHILVGPNGSGKTTFLDALGFISDLVSKGLDSAVSSRTGDLTDLMWQHTARQFRLAVELEIPEVPKAKYEEPWYDTVRYEVEVGFDEATREDSILAETVLLQMSDRDAENTTVLSRTGGRLSAFPEPEWPRRANVRRGRCAELPVKRCDSALSAPFESYDRPFPVCAQLSTFLKGSIYTQVLNSQTMRRPSPPGGAHTFSTDGSNLPWHIVSLIRDHREQHTDWIKHVRTAVPDVEDIRTVVRREDGHCYLVVRYKDGVELPSWSVSDGTLRLLALTLLAYTPNLKGVFLIDEPENGIHPKAIETVFQSLSSVYDAQVLLATHSPLIVGLADLSQVLCFTKNEEGATEIVRGDEHRILRHWKGETSLGTLFAGGVLDARL